MIAKRILLIIIVSTLFLSPAVNPLCETDGMYRERHPLICNTSGGPFTLTPGSGVPSGGGDNGGLLGTIGKILGGLTGGLL